MSKDKPFFLQPDTKRAIDKIRRSKKLVIYAGAGVTIDKSGLTWTRLIEGLLEPHIPNRPARQSFVRSEHPLFAASAAHKFFLDASDERSPQSKETDARQRIVDTLRPLLYGPGTWRSGDLSAAIADFVYLWNYSSLRKRHRSRSACIVTTNYDNYLISAMETAHDVRLTELKEKGNKKSKKDAKNLAKPSVVFATRGDPLEIQSPKLKGWVERRTLPERSRPSCIHLHGYVPRNFKGREKKSPYRLPVVSEQDYFWTSHSSEEALVSLFRESDVIIVGASLTDAPLIRALEGTARSGNRRWAITSTPQGSHRDEYRRLVEARLSTLKVRPIYADYYVQQAQFFRELGVGTVFAKKRYSRCKSTYYHRLERWWDELGLEDKHALPGMQLAVHEYLSTSVLKTIKKKLSSGEESLKIEVWIRWKPDNFRELKLFGSSVGVWSDAALMRSERIQQAQPTIVVEAFRSGRPELRSNKGSRWKTLLAVPVWSNVREQKFISSVILVASQSVMAESALNEDTNRAAIAECSRLLMGAGTAITDPNIWEKTEVKKKKKKKN